MITMRRRLGTGLHTVVSVGGHRRARKFAQAIGQFGRESVTVGVRRLRLTVCFEPMRLTLHQSLAFACALGCGSSTPAPEQPVYSAADDEAVLRDPVLDAVANPDATRRPTHAVPPTSRPEASTNSPAPATQQRSRVGIRGITGSLTAFEVDEAMATRSEALMACVQQRPTRLGHVAGDIKFHMDVDAQGKADRVLITESNIGYPALEACLSAVVATAPFPTPAGQQRAEAAWHMSVDPLGRGAEPVDTAELEEAIALQSAATYEACNIDHDLHFAVTGYIDHGGRFGALSVRSPWRGPDRAPDDNAEAIACLIQSLGEWTHLPRASRHTKATFELKWVVAPEVPRPRARGRKKSERNRSHRQRQH
jgi:hypothetical protein